MNVLRILLFLQCNVSLLAWVSVPYSLSTDTTHRVDLSLYSSASTRIDTKYLKELSTKNYVVVENFISQELEGNLREDVKSLRSDEKFNVARIGQDMTNTLNTDIRVAETCFIGPEKLVEVPCASRNSLYTVLDNVRADLDSFFGKPLDSSLTELLYAYYPQGGFYRRHRDAIPGSASTLREYSLLLYLNKDWNTADGGALRMHMDSGGDFLPDGEDPNYEDVAPKGGTLVLFKSDAIPHEVLDTNSERIAVVGWYNRPVSAGDIADLSGLGNVDPGRVGLLAVAAALVTAGVLMLNNL